jgi:hypothetical protein
VFPSTYCLDRLRLRLIKPLTKFKATMEPRMVAKRCIDEAKSYVEREDFSKVKRRRLHRSALSSSREESKKVNGLKLINLKRF